MTQIQAEALQRATENRSVANYAAIYDGFAAKGIPEDQIEPRVNVFTYEAWKAQGRQVRRGEHGVRVTTWVPMTRKNAETGEKETIGRRPKTAVVFHVTQTDPLAVPTHTSN